MEEILTQKNDKINYCESCDYTSCRKSDFNKHCLAASHIKRVNGANGAEKNSARVLNFSCLICDFHAFNKQDFSRHIETKKHLKKSQPTEPSEIEQFQCILCNKCYSTKSNLKKHTLTCNTQTKDIIIPTKDGITPDFLLEFIKQNKELQNTLVEQNQDLQKQMIQLAKNQSVTNNNTNNQFNLQFFLNETCKDAINITDFVNSLQLQVADFEATGSLGYVDGISRIILNGLKVMDANTRPVHCTDAKRETVYIKDKDTWEKENPDKRKLKWAINRVAQMNFNQLPKWQEENPECFDISTKKNEEYIHLSLTALGGQGKVEEDKFMDKIMRNVLKKVTI